MTESSLSQPEKSIVSEFFAKDATIALVIQLTSLVLTYLVQVSLAQLMGRTEYGIYEYVNAVILLVSVPAGLGFPRTALRLISEYKVKEEWGSLRGILRVSLSVTFFASILLSLIGAGIVLLVNHYHNFVYAIPLLFGTGLLPLQALAHLQTETTMAMESIALAYAPFEIIWPLLLLCSAFFLWQPNHSLTSLSLIGTATLTLFVVVVVQYWLFTRKVKAEVKPAKPVYAYRQWMGLSFILLIQQSFFLILAQSDILMVGSLMGPGEAGIYNAAVSSSQWVGVVLLILNTVASPRFAALYALGDIQGLQKLVASVNSWIFWPTLAISLCLLVFTQPILSLFGPDFITASWTLKILVVGKLFDALCGSVTSLMTMTGNQNKSFPVFGYCLVFNLILHAIAIPLFGIIGAAIASSFTMIVWNIWLSFLVAKHVGINPSIFTLFNREMKLAKANPEEN